MLELTNAAVSTAGSSEQHVDIGGRRYSHIIDPSSGMGLVDDITVTVIARHGLDADGLDTAASVLGAERGLALIESRPDAAALIIERTSAGTTVRPSSRFWDFAARRLIDRQPLAEGNRSVLLFSFGKWLSVTPQCDRSSRERARTGRRFRRGPPSQRARNAAAARAESRPCERCVSAAAGSPRCGIERLPGADLRYSGVARALRRFISWIYSTEPATRRLVRCSWALQRDALAIWSPDTSPALPRNASCSRNAASPR